MAEISFHVVATLCLSDRVRSSIIQRNLGMEPGLEEVDCGGSGITSDPESYLAFLFWGFPVVVNQEQIQGRLRTR